VQLYGLKERCESLKQNAMATSFHTRNDRDSMAPATAANGLRTVTCWRSTWLNHAYPAPKVTLSLAVTAAVVAIRRETRKSADSASRWVRPIALVDEGGTAPLPFPPFCPARANTGKVTARLGTKLRRAGLGHEALRAFGRSETQVCLTGYLCTICNSNEGCFNNKRPELPPPFP
jgi:hypothetical protein